MRRIAHGNQINRHSNSNKRQEQANCDGQCLRVSGIKLAAIHFRDEPRMVPGRKQVDGDAGPNERSPKPQRQAGRLHRGSMRDKLHLLQKQRESRYYKTESHQSQSGPNPRQQSSLGSQIIPQVSSSPRWNWLIHFSASQGRMGSFVFGDGRYKMLSVQFSSVCFTLPMNW